MKGVNDLCNDQLLRDKMVVLDFRCPYFIDLNHKSKSMTCKIEIIEGKALQAMDINGKSDPYVIMYFGGINLQQKRTTTRYKTLMPVWNETFYFSCCEAGIDTIRMELWDQDTLTSDDYLGEILFSVCREDLSDPTGDVCNGPMHEGDHWFDIMVRAEDGHLKPGAYGQLRVRWLYIPGGGLFAVRDSLKPITIKEVDEHQVEEDLPELDTEIINSNILRIKAHFSSYLVPFREAHRVLLWDNPLETILWFYLLIVAAMHEVLFFLIPIFILSILIKNMWAFLRYGPEGKDIDTDFGAVDRQGELVKEDEKEKKDFHIRVQESLRSVRIKLQAGLVEAIPPLQKLKELQDQLQDLHKMARRFQKYSGRFLSYLDYVSESLRWTRWRNTLLISVVCLGLPILPYMVNFLLSFIPPAYYFTVPTIVYLFTVYPMYENFPVIKRKYSPRSLAKMLMRPFKGFPTMIRYGYLVALRSLFKYNPEYAYRVQKFVLQRKIQKNEKEICERYNIMPGDTRRHAFITFVACRRVDHSIGRKGLSIRCSLKVPGHRAPYPERTTSKATVFPPVWNERVSFTGVPMPTIPCWLGGAKEILVIEFLWETSVYASTEVDLGSHTKNYVTDDYWVELTNVDATKRMVELCIGIALWNLGSPDPSLLKLERSYSHQKKYAARKERPKKGANQNNDDSAVITSKAAAEASPEAPNGMLRFMPRQRKKFDSLVIALDAIAQDCMQAQATKKNYSPAKMTADTLPETWRGHRVKICKGQRDSEVLCVEIECVCLLCVKIRHSGGTKTLVHCESLLSAVDVGAILRVTSETDDVVVTPRGIVTPSVESTPRREATPGRAVTPGRVATPRIIEATPRGDQPSKRFVLRCTKAVATDTPTLYHNCLLEAENAIKALMKGVVYHPTMRL